MKPKNVDGDTDGLIIVRGGTQGPKIVVGRFMGPKIMTCGNVESWILQGRNVGPRMVRGVIQS